MFMKVERVATLPGTEGTWKIESETEKGTFYYVQALQIRHKHAKTVTTLVCNCWPAWKELANIMNGNNPVPCKHCKTVMDFLDSRQAASR